MQEPIYDIESLKRNIDKCDDNIKLFQDTIMTEMETKATLKEHLRRAEDAQNS